MTNVHRALAAAALGALAALALASIAAGHAGGQPLLRFVDNHIRVAYVGFNGTGIPPVGSEEIFTGRLYNERAQFGHPRGAVVGRFSLDCTVVSAVPDGICQGIAHVPDGFFTFAGNGPFTQTEVRNYAVTGGVGPYQAARGEFRVANLPDGGSLSLLVLST